MTPSDGEDITMRRLRRAESRLVALAGAAQAFAEATTDYDRLIDVVAQRIAESVADACAVHTLSDDGAWLQPVAGGARDPAMRELLRAYNDLGALEVATRPHVQRLLGTGQPLYVPHVDRAWMQANGAPETVWLHERMAFHGLMVLALRAQGRSIGMLALLRYRPESPRFDDEDLDTARALADQAALSIANARAFVDQQRHRAELADREAKLAHEKRRFDALSDAGMLGVQVGLMDKGRVTLINDTLLKMVGYERDEILSGAVPWQALSAPESFAVDREAIAQLLDTGVAKLREKIYIHKDGHRVPAMVGSARLGDTSEVISFVVDMTERKQMQRALDKAEAQLRQVQKMDAVGRLAGGIAHDFNNIISVISSYAMLAQETLAPEAATRDDLREIQYAAQRASELTRQLLMFSRLQIIEPRLLDVGVVLEELGKLLRRLVGEDIELAIEVPPAGQCVARADRASLEQVIMNLAVNARHAMPRGGRLVIEVQHTTFDERRGALPPDLTAGPYVMLAVTDTGVGMDAQTQARIFEPFFTTKPVGHGTGLGLSTVYGIVKQSGGAVWVDSEPGRGASFKVFLPHVTGVVDDVARVDPSYAQGGAETVLVVEDDPQVRTVAAAILERYGYAVLVASDADEALRLCQQEKFIALLLTDVVMPRVSGPQLALRLRELQPEMRVLFMSGYTDDAVIRHGVQEGEVAYVQKPITPVSLARKVREVLDGGAS